MTLRSCLVGEVGLGMEMGLSDSYLKTNLDSPSNIQIKLIFQKYPFVN